MQLGWRTAVKSGKWYCAFQKAKQRSTTPKLKPFQGKLQIND